MTTSTVVAYRDCLAEKLAEQAAWREDVAERFTADARNRRAAGALQAAADYVRGLDPEKHEGIRKLHDFGVGVAGERDPWVVVSLPEEAGRFFFDRAPVSPGPDDFEGLISDVYLATLEDWRTSWESSGEDDPDERWARILRFIREELGDDPSPGAENGLLSPDRPRGQFGGHLREAFLDWVSSGQPDTVAMELGYEDEDWPAGRFLDYFLGCTDILSRSACEDLQMPWGSTYGQAAREELARRASGGGWVFVYEDEDGRLRWEDDEAG